MTVTGNINRDGEVVVDGVGHGWIASVDGDRVTIEFANPAEDPITVPRSHLTDARTITVTGRPFVAST